MATSAGLKCLLIYLIYIVFSLLADLTYTAPLTTTNVFYPDFSTESQPRRSLSLFVRSERTGSGSRPLRPRPSGNPLQVLLVEQIPLAL